MSSLKGIVKSASTSRHQAVSEPIPATIIYTSEDVGKILRRRRKQMGLTQAQLAMVMGYSPRLISELERGRETVAFGTVLRVANWLGMDLSLAGR